MSVLEFIQVLISIILALGIAELLKGVADYLRADGARPSRLLFGLGGWLVLIHVHFWWIGWRFRDVETWMFPELVLYVAGPVILYLAARLLFPQDLANADLPAYYARHGPKVWFFVALFFAYTVPVNTILLDVPLLSSGPATQVGLLLLAMIARKTSNAWFHAVTIVLLYLQLVWRATANVVGSG